MEFTDNHDFELPGDSAGVRGNEFESSYDDDENFTLLPDRGDSAPRSGGNLAHRRASAMEDDDLTDIALHFGER